MSLNVFILEEDHEVLMQWLVVTILEVYQQWVVERIDYSITMRHHCLRINVMPRM